jgi:hypothetical protein
MSFIAVPLANDKERGSTTNITIIDDKLFLDWERTEENPDIITVNLRDKLAPNQKLNYSSHILSSPSDKFTKYGYDNNGRDEPKDMVPHSCPI